MTIQRKCNKTIAVDKKVPSSNGKLLIAEPMANNNFPGISCDAYFWFYLTLMGREASLIRGAYRSFERLWIFKSALFKNYAAHSDGNSIGRGLV